MEGAIVGRLSRRLAANRPTTSYERLYTTLSTRHFYCEPPGDNLVMQFTAFYMKKEIHVRSRLSNILVQKFFL
jgi:hypothetical protein